MLYGHILRFNNKIRQSGIIWQETTTNKGKQAIAIFIAYKIRRIMKMVFVHKQVKVSNDKGSFVKIVGPEERRQAV